MKSEELIALALAGIAMWMILSSRKAKANVDSMPAIANAAPTNTIQDRLLNGGETETTGNLIPNTALPGQPGWGWLYFDTGISIGPDGAYYQGGQKVWAPK